MWIQYLRDWEATIQTRRKSLTESVLYELDRTQTLHCKPRSDTEILRMKQESLRFLQNWFGSGFSSTWSYDRASRLKDEFHVIPISFCSKWKRVSLNKIFPESSHNQYLSGYHLSSTHCIFTELFPFFFIASNGQYSTVSKRIQLLAIEKRGCQCHVKFRNVRNFLVSSQLEKKFYEGASRHLFVMYCNAMTCLEM